MKYAFCFLCGLMLSGCSKIELPPSFGEDPVFSLSLAWQDGSSLHLKAGEDRYYLFTDAAIDSLQVVEFSGRFEQLDCLSSCGPSFAVFIRNDEIDSSALTVKYPDFLSQNMPAPFRNPSSPLYDTLTAYRVQLSPSVSGGGPAIPLIWTIDDSLVLVGPNLQIVRPNAAPFSACLDYGAPATGCYSRQCQTVRLDNIPPFSVTIASNPGDSLLLATPLGGQPPYAYIWSNGGSDASVSAEPGVGYCVTVTDAQGSVASQCLQAAFPGTMACSASFSYQVDPEIIVNPIPGDSLQLKSVTLQYIDAEGRIYRTDLQAQPQNAYFIIDEKELYKPNENGHATMRIKARFSGVLFESGGGPPLFVDSASVSFAVKGWTGH